MSRFIGPSHHLFFRAMQHRFNWLELLQQEHQIHFADAWVNEREQLRPQISELTVLQNGSLLTKALIDIPVESFLNSLHENLNAFEFRFFESVLKLKKSFSRYSVEIDENLKEASMLWGRILAQEYLSTNPSSNLLKERCLKGLLESFQYCFIGGDFLWKPILIRRYTDAELQYEVRNCPHARFSAQKTKTVADISCQLESYVYESFSRALLSSIQHKRSTIKNAQDHYCVDEFKV